EGARCAKPVTLTYKGCRHYFPAFGGSDSMALYPHPKLPSIPVVDIRDAGLMHHCIEGGDRARLLRDDCMTFLPPVVRPLVPTMDRVTRRWLRRSASPYVAEVEAVARALKFPGVWFLNGCYQWGCTTLAR